MINLFEKVVGNCATAHSHYSGTVLRLYVVSYRSLLYRKAMVTLETIWASRSAPPTEGLCVLQIENQKVDFKAQSKVGSLANVNYKPGGGDIKIFDDKDYLKQISGAASSIASSEEDHVSGTQVKMLRSMCNLVSRNSSAVFYHAIQESLFVLSVELPWRYLHWQLKIR
jgi:hypothetical protein